eukprot:TRINITY_DN16896_c0_g1_i3.p1 TRINITY_DN16896_c0_g1~~TRINITY_DN16896_c0_g1_i3.p1  ORF type:complete len:631 (+),score=62.75 TRINITY_DN16896_c0_g1_i3:71-1963(+)
MPREQGRRREARKAYFAAKNGQGARRPLTSEEAAAMFSGIDRNDQRGFGIRQLADADVNAVLDAPPALKPIQQTTLLDYACFRGRDPHVLSLLNAGADPSLGVLCPHALDVLPSPYVAWLAKAAAEMRRRSMTRFSTNSNEPEAAQKCICGAPASLLFSPCAHWCCNACLWRPFSVVMHDEANDDLSDMPEFVCPQCNCTFRYASQAVHENTVETHVKKGLMSDVSSCFKGCLPFLPGASSRSRQIAKAKCRASYKRWEALPDAMPQTAEEWAKVRESKPGKEQRSAVLEPQNKSKGRIKLGPFKAFSKEECASNRLGLTRSQRSDNVRRSAERGDARRLLVLLEAGADLGDLNEYGHTPLLAAAWKGRGDAVDLLLQWGADPNAVGNGGVTAISAAAACDHCRVVRLLLAAGCSLQPSPPRFGCTPTGRLTPVPVSSACAPGMRACYLDGIFPEEFLNRLETLWRSLPVAAKGSDYDELSVQDRKQLLERRALRVDRSQQEAAPRRSYFCDAEGWILHHLHAALRQELHVEAAGDFSWPCEDSAGSCASAPCKTGHPQMRFLHYAEEGGFLAPHTARSLQVLMSKMPWEARLYCWRAWKLDPQQWPRLRQLEADFSCSRTTVRIEPCPL